MNKFIAFDYKKPWVYLSIVAAILGIVLLIYAPANPGFANHTYESIITPFLVLGVICGLLGAVCNIRLAKDILGYASVLFYAIAVGYIAYHGATVIADHYNGVNWVDGNYDAVCVYLSLGCLSLIFATASCFEGHPKAKEEAVA